MQTITRYFPQLSSGQAQQFAALDALYRDWNAKINLISRKDIDNLYIHHVLHSLAIAKLLTFRPSTTVMDVGTGGGFPGIPLAILFPQCNFLLVDSIAKKIKVCTQVSQALGLTNVTCVWSRVEEIKEKFDFVVSRAVMPLPNLIKIVRKNISPIQRNAMPNGLICLKGGEIESETTAYKQRTIVTEISDFFQEEYFKTKKVVYVTL